MNACVLRDLLTDLVDSPYPSDAASRLVVTRLSWNRIPHRAMLGQVRLGDRVLKPHFWVEVGDQIIDYAAREGRSEMLQGVFSAREAEGMYQGQEIIIDPLPKYLCDLIYRTPHHEPV
ncbi:hypothetical protein [Stutzerimonas tarimensis]|uniref:Uncharacterized protein n=1 Tax=Stutzerimonas tarimensis TaxID=1507735 RepID=A0ABV7T709_9GAMM